MKVTYCVKKGKNKEKCDDSALISSYVVNDNSGQIEVYGKSGFFIADGVGGNAGGDEASLYVVNAVKNINSEDIDTIKKNLLEINDNLIDYGRSITGHEQMATTLTGIIFDTVNTVMIHCGNTRLYALQGSFLKQITSDQTTYQWLMSTGNSDAAENCNKSEIRGAFGGGNAKFVETLVVNNIFERGIPTKVLMTSDGVHDILNIDDIEDIITCDSVSSMEKINMLIEAAINKGSEDDCTAVLIELD